MKLAILVALSENGVIGLDGKLPWRLPDELKFVKRTTMGHALLMGRKTYESIGKPLPGRTSIVLSRDPGYAPHPEVLVVPNFEAGLDLARERGESETFVFGGETVYATALRQADRLYLTRVHCDIEGDARFPALDAGEWKLASEEHHELDERHQYAFTLQTLDRIR
jgi:dihydrofolate reductase